MRKATNIMYLYPKNVFLVYKLQYYYSTISIKLENNFDWSFPIFQAVSIMKNLCACM